MLPSESLHNRLPSHELRAAQGYYCPAGSTSATVAACGGTDRYCPPGSGAPIYVGAATNIYTIPTTLGTENYRTNVAACPAFRQCSAGLLLPGLSFSNGCASGSAGTPATVGSGVPNSLWGPTFIVSTPGYSGSINWTITSVVPADVGCPVTAAYFNVSVLSLTSASLWVGSTAVQLSQCPNGFSLVLNAARANDVTLNAQCTIAAAGASISAQLFSTLPSLHYKSDSAVGQIIAVPTITNCATPRSVNERSPTGTFIGSAMDSINSNSGTTTTWMLLQSAGIPISIGLCDGHLRVLTPFQWRVAQSYTVIVQVRSATTTMPH